jgi:hypothetical protein
LQNQKYQKTGAHQKAEHAQDYVSCNNTIN